MVDIYHFFKYKITKEKKHISISYISWHTLFKSNIDTPAHRSDVHLTLMQWGCCLPWHRTFLPGRAHYKHAASRAMRSEGCRQSSDADEYLRREHAAYTYSTLSLRFAQYLTIKYVFEFDWYKLQIGYRLWICCTFFDTMEDSYWPKP